MMKYILYIAIIFLAACSTEIPEKRLSAGYQGEETGFRGMVTHCLRNFLVGEDPGGVWTIITKPSGSILIQADLDGTDNPCIDFEAKGCGVYQLQYKVTETCCIDSSRITINKRCCNINGTFFCN